MTGKGYNNLYVSILKGLSKIHPLVLRCSLYLSPRGLRLSREEFVDRASLAIVLGGMIIFVILHIINANTAWPSFRYGAVPEGEIFRTLDREIGLRNSSFFRGRLANIAKIEPQSLPDGRLYTYEAMQALDHYIAFPKASGADFRHSTIVNDIPTLFDVTRFVSPGTVAAMNYFLAEPMHYKQSQFLYPSRFDSHWMAFFGIRYVVHNELVTDVPPPIASQDFGDYQLHLYEIQDPNTGNYTPTEVVVADSLPQALTFMASPRFDFRKTVIVEKPVFTPLVQATSAELKIVDGILVYRGTSPGWSLAVLPFEYSNCLRVMPSADFSGPLPTLQRVNSHQIGLLFEGVTSVRISFHFSPFDNSQCRLEDVRDWQNLNASGAVSFGGVNIFGGMTQ